MLKLFKTYLKPFAGLAILACVFTLLQVIAELQLPSIMSDIVDVGIYNQDFDYVITQGLIMLAWALASVVFVIIAALCAARSSMGFGRDIRSDLFRKVQHFSLVEFNEFGTSTLITRNTNDIQQLERFTQMMLSIAVMTPAMLIGSCVMAFSTNAEIAAIIFVVIPILVIVVAVFLRFGMPLLRSLQKRIDGVNRVMREGLTGVRVVRAYNREDYEQKRFHNVNRDLADTYIKVGRLMGGLMPLMMLILNGTIVGLYWFGGSLIDTGSFSAGEIMAMVQYITMVLMSVMMLSMIFALLPRTMAASERINEVLNTNSSIVDPAPMIDSEATSASMVSSSEFEAMKDVEYEPSLHEIEQEVAQQVLKTDHVPHSGVEGGVARARNEERVVEFCDAAYRFKGAQNPCLHNISFTCNPGTTTVVIGPTGSGKSVLMNLILRFYDCESGQVRFNGRDVQDWMLKDLRQRISYVPQKAMLFTGTIAENMRFGNELATDEEIWRALDVAQAREFIATHEEGLDYHIAQGGQNLSGGQRQRLTIARALLAPADLYIFDDSFSALDFKTDALVRKGISSYLANKTLIIVSQRVSVGLDAQQIIMLSDTGTIEACGTHEELYATCEPYRELALSQLSEDELTNGEKNSSCEDLQATAASSHPENKRSGGER